MALQDKLNHIAWVLYSVQTAQEVRIGSMKDAVAHVEMRFNEHDHRRDFILSRITALEEAGKPSHPTFKRILDQIEDQMLEVASLLE